MSVPWHGSRSWASHRFRYSDPHRPDCLSYPTGPSCFAVVTTIAATTNATVDVDVIIATAARLIVYYFAACCCCCWSSVRTFGTRCSHHSSADRFAVRRRTAPDTAAPSSSSCSNCKCLSQCWTND